MTLDVEGNSERTQRANLSLRRGSRLLTAQAGRTPLLAGCVHLPDRERGSFEGTNTCGPQGRCINLEKVDIDLMIK